MPLFAIHCLDKPGAGDLRSSTRPAHLIYLQTFAQSLFAAGALLGLDGAPIGSLLILDCADRKAAYAFAAADPYSLAGLFQSVAITAWRRLYPLFDGPPGAA